MRNCAAKSDYAELCGEMRTAHFFRPDKKHAFDFGQKNRGSCGNYAENAGNSGNCDYAEICGGKCGPHDSPPHLFLPCPHPLPGALLIHSFETSGGGDVLWRQATPWCHLASNLIAINNEVWAKFWANEAKSKIVTKWSGQAKLSTKNYFDYPHSVRGA